MWPMRWPELHVTVTVLGCWNWLRLSDEFAVTVFLGPIRVMWIRGAAACARRSRSKTETRPPIPKPLPPPPSLT